MNMIGAYRGRLEEFREKSLGHVECYAQGLNSLARMATSARSADDIILTPHDYVEGEGKNNNDNMNISAKL